MTQPSSHDDHSAAARPVAGRKRALSRGRRLQLAAAALLVVSGLAGSGLACWLRPPDLSEHDDAPSGPLAHLFRGWDKPDLALIVTADQHGYLLPCGCSNPQKGGLERRYNFIQMLKDRGWPVAAVDLGNVPQMTAPADLPNIQGLIKYRYAMKAMKVMNYTAVGIGDHEAAMPLLEVLAEYALNEPKPAVVSANLKDRSGKFADMAKAWREVDPIKGVNFTIGVTGLVGPSVKDEMQKKDASLGFDDSVPALNAVLKEMDAKKIDLRVLLYMGSISKGWAGSPPEAVACAEAYPQFPLIVAQDDGDLPRTDAVWATNAKTGARTMIVALGEKAKYVGVVGVYHTNKPGQPFDLRYQLVEMTEDFATPKGQEAGQPGLKLMNEYTEELKRDNYLGKYAQRKHPMQATAVGKMPTYVGTERCIDCHPTAGKVWENSDHSHAYQMLVEKAKRPSNRQYDPECIVCHTVGFTYQTGFTSAEKTPKLKNVGCESCHGPGSLHANNPNNMAERALMNPWKAPANETAVQKARRMRRIDDFCQKCHDTENDVNWTEHGFERKWPQIVHVTPPEEKADEPGDK